MPFEILSQNFIQYLALIGTGLVALGYIPEIKHIFEEHCTGGKDPLAWIIWTLASVFLLAHAIAIQDVVFIILQLINVSFVAFMILLVAIYGRSVCHSHEMLLKHKNTRKS